jgi:hypothetical protein
MVINDRLGESANMIFIIGIPAKAKQKRLNAFQKQYQILGYLYKYIY